MKCMKEFQIGGVNITKSEGDDQKALDASLSLLNLQKKLKGIDRVFIKINLLVAESYELGTVSDPFILEGIIKEIRKYSDKEIVITESESVWCTEILLGGEASAKEEHIAAGLKLALKNSGTQEILDKYNLRFLNATKAPKASRDDVLKLVKQHFPKNVKDIDEDMLEMVPSEFLEGNPLFISYNKMKTHRMRGVGVTLACKNLFGLITNPNCVPFHDGGKGLLNSMLSINLIYNAIFENKVGFVECLRYAIEGDGPDTEKGVTKKNAGLIVAGENFLEVDTVAIRLMDIDSKYTVFVDKLRSCYPPFKVNLEKIPEEFIAKFRQPEHWEGVPPPEWTA